ncbi:hypothetical protein CDG77_32395 [Nostoc sp. 'Peltigera membranacea cyanobiont' 213]|uniref:hypothetical protein n=1 Tax=Nostoc sp. 'Peltigera membranacea cyanobiont' 213 TaxID=2014530 RepID=UPI000B959330|nr:hypothetical protein [Nostoc sp. 'Peltigera membranacea cyanobiont' 213]OYD86891.1 hypothetical protein CDG77_32395 [Nostoc sp. 'Peltigera membranacea cyanobiont' 213]
MGEYPKQFWQFCIQWLWVTVSMELATQQDSEEVVRGIGQNFPQLVSHATPVVSVSAVESLYILIQRSMEFSSHSTTG